MKQLFVISLLLAPFFARAEEWRWDFATGDLAEWTIVEGGEWQLVDHPQRGRILELSASGEPPAEPVRRAANVLLLPSPAVESFSLEFDAKTPLPDHKGADVIVVFGYQDPHHYYYAHISNDSDDRFHHIIMKVDGSQRTRTLVDNEQAPLPVLNGKWQKIRLTRASNGRIEIFVDDMPEPTLTTDDSEWLKGRVGIGTFNDPAQFDCVVLKTLPTS